jgi:hypothetical protein
MQYNYYNHNHTYKEYFIVTIGKELLGYRRTVFVVVYIVSLFARVGLSIVPEFQIDEYECQS